MQTVPSLPSERETPSIPGCPGRPAPNSHSKSACPAFSSPRGRGCRRPTPPSRPPPRATGPNPAGRPPAAAHTSRAEARHQGRLTRLQLPGLPGAREGETFVLVTLPSPVSPRPQHVPHTQQAVRWMGSCLPHAQASARRALPARHFSARVRVLRAVFRPRVRGPGRVRPENGMSQRTFVERNNSRFLGETRSDRHARTPVPAHCALRRPVLCSLCPRQRGGPGHPRRESALNFGGSGTATARARRTFSGGPSFPRLAGSSARRPSGIASGRGGAGRSGGGGGEGHFLEVVERVPQRSFAVYFSNQAECLLLCVSATFVLPLNSLCSRTSALFWLGELVGPVSVLYILRGLALCLSSKP